ncbi:MAG: putative leucine carboxyl methyltransferase 1 [Streblomastix strix]|uniref:[phosphatase 2A protein]-leucine-carboxy methyltransferase n=1 Tax=Streblomastix strix TaxID=222440 RepID=A0A5J4WG09_9EUKA|nr:MAG: putative leucine carboxyl methyltransferase 1 [Streblomastix strix]
MSQLGLPEEIIFPRSPVHYSTINMEPPQPHKPKSSLLEDIFGAVDSATAKASCIQTGYYDDQLLLRFIEQVEPRPRLINRGYFARVFTILKCIASFCKSVQGEKQVVMLGAGFDSYFLTIKNDLPGLILWVDIDLPEVVEAKQRIYSQKLTPEQRAIHQIVTGDLLSIPSIHESLRKAKLNPRIPTIFVLECVTAYIPPENVRSLLKYIAQPSEFASIIKQEDGSAESLQFPLIRGPVQVIGYDPMSNETDNFGRVMIQNLKRRGIEMPSLMAFPSCDARKSALRDSGFINAVAYDMNKAYQNIPQAERKRIEKIEPLDEFEEFHLLLSHYCAWQGTSQLLEEIGLLDDNAPLSTIGPQVQPSRPKQHGPTFFI